MIELLLALIVGSALLWLWLSGHWFVRIMATLAFFPALVVALDPMLSRPANVPADATVAIAWLALCAALAWCLASLPTWCRRQREQRRLAPIRRGMEMLHPHWTPAQIESEVGLYRRR